MTRKYHVRIRDAETGKLLLTFKGKVERKKQAKGRIAGGVEETLFVSNAPSVALSPDLRTSIIKTKKNFATLERASVTMTSFGTTLKDIAERYIEEPDTKLYSLQSMFADLASMFVDTFDDQSKSSISIANEGRALAKKLEDQHLLEG